MKSSRKRGVHSSESVQKSPRPPLPGQVVLVLQGGGALGAYQAGVYEALHEAGIEPDWVIGTSIGAINGALIAGNPPKQRLERLHAFWKSVEQNAGAYVPEFFSRAFGNAMVNLATMARGIPRFFAPNPMALFGQHASVGIQNAAYYTTAPLRKTLAKLVDFDYINGRHTRISLGAVKVCDGEMTYFDSREETIAMEHVMASGALPPAFPAIRIKDDFYWDGGIYSNTPIEAVLDDKPRRDSLIFTVDVWNPEGATPETLWQVAGREKDIRYASRARSHIARQKQIHHLRHIISELSNAMPEKIRSSLEVKELASWGCRTTIHIARLVAAGIDGEDQMKDIDFTPASVRSRWQAGYADTRRMLDLSPWDRPVDPVEGVIIHTLLADAVAPPLAAGLDGFEGKTK
jgi:NTE family protein